MKGYWGIQSSIYKPGVYIKKKKWHVYKNISEFIVATIMEKWGKKALVGGKGHSMKALYNI